MQTIEFISFDNKRLSVGKDIAFMSLTVKEMYKFLDNIDEPIHINQENATLDILEFIFKSCECPDQVNLEHLSNDDLAKFIHTCDYLQIESFVDKGCFRVASIIKGSNEEDLKKLFGMAKD